MTSSPSTLPQPSHEGDEGQSAGRKTSRPPGPKKALSRVSDAEQQVVARYVDHDTACDDAQPGRTAEPRKMFQQPGGLFCLSMENHQVQDILAQHVLQDCVLSVARQDIFNGIVLTGINSHIS